MGRPGDVFVIAMKQDEVSPVNHRKRRRWCARWAGLDACCPTTGVRRIELGVGTYSKQVAVQGDWAGLDAIYSQPCSASMVTVRYGDVRAAELAHGWR